MAHAQDDRVPWACGVRVPWRGERLARALVRVREATAGSGYHEDGAAWLRQTARPGCIAHWAWLRPLALMDDSKSIIGIPASWRVAGGLRVA